MREKRKKKKKTLASSGLKNLWGGLRDFLAAAVSVSAERDTRSMRGMNCTTALSPPAKTCNHLIAFAIEIAIAIAIQIEIAVE